MYHNHYQVRRVSVNPQFNVGHLYVPQPLPGTDGESVNPQFKFNVEHLYHDRY